MYELFRIKADHLLYNDAVDNGHWWIHSHGTGENGKHLSIGGMILFEVKIVLLMQKGDFISGFFLTRST